MKTIRFSAMVLALVAVCVIPGQAQCSPAFSLTTAAPNTGQAGVMFDLEPTGGSALRIESFDVYVTGTVNYEIWVRPPLQSFVGFQSSNAGWTLVGSAPGIVGSGTTASVPLNLCLGYTLQPGGRTGFYVTTVGGGTHWYFTGTAVGASWASDTRLTIYQGHSGGYFSCTISPRCFGGSVRYSLGENILTMSQSAPTVGDLTVALTTLTAAATEGWTLVSADVSAPMGTGPLIGLRPDASTWLVLMNIPLADGNPFHFPIPSAYGLFPNAPFAVGPGAVSALTGQTLDFAVLLVSAGPFYAGRSNVVRFTFH